MMPRAPTAQCSSAPPVKRLYMPSTEAPLAAWVRKNSANTAPSSPGMRTTASSRQMARTIRVNKIRDLSSGILKQLLKVLAMAESMANQNSKSEGRNPKQARRPKSETSQKAEIRNDPEQRNPQGVSAPNF